MDQLHTSVMLTTSSHRMVGRIVNAGQRLHDIINNKLSTCLNVYDVALFRPTGDGTPIAQLPEVTLPKERLNLILLHEQVHEAPTSRLFSFVQKNVYQTFLTVPGYEVQGRLHITTLQKPETFLTDALTSFLPITQASVTHVTDASQSWTVSVVFVRRFSIELFHLGEPQ
jgi:hypothetical protein